MARIYSNLHVSFRIRVFAIETRLKMSKNISLRVGFLESLQREIRNGGARSLTCMAKEISLAWPRYQHLRLLLPFGDVSESHEADIGLTIRWRVKSLRQIWLYRWMIERQMNQCR
jgi:hypothetical protein